MPTLVAGDILEAKVYCSLGSQLAINVLHYRVSLVTGVSVTTAATAARLEFLLGGPYKDLLPTQARFRGVGIHRLFPGVPTIEEYSILEADDGIVDGDPLPKQTCGVITKQTGLAGRSNRGRVYVPFPSETHNTTGGTPAAAYLGFLGVIAGILEEAQEVGTDPNAATIQPILYHRLDGSYTFISNCLPRSRWGTQRRRGDYGQTNVIGP